jgi:hypothetical protein
VCCESSGPKPPAAAPPSLASGNGLAICYGIGRSGQFPLVTSPSTVQVCHCNPSQYHQAMLTFYEHQIIYAPWHRWHRWHRATGLSPARPIDAGGPGAIGYHGAHTLASARGRCRDHNLCSSSQRTPPRPVMVSETAGPCSRRTMQMPNQGKQLTATPSFLPEGIRTAPTAGP